MSEPDMDALRGWIGREEEASDVITPGLVERFTATLGPSAFAQAGSAPLAIHWCLAPPAVPPAMIGPDGHPRRGGFLPPVPLPRRMWAGGRLRLIEPLTIGKTVTRRSRIADITRKTGRSGEMIFVAVDHVFECDGREAIRERHDIVYREAASPATASPRAGGAPAGSDENAAADGQTVCDTVEATPPLLFRYSALTFNAHRIHYDLDYARDVEGYPGLVVHGPLQATLMIHLAARMRGGPPREMVYRGLAPLFHGSAFTVNARPDGDGAAEAWCASADGVTTMTASMRF
ncbi:MAG: MaoC family dehydratase N-terminal domain-containing protein [Rhizobiaceae bacterium]|nr:MaoC family dehydratase N-terminal domain-containing protein [Rhizobiaceae bacterium]MCV0404971.1 MaoC family dehydratase N-terminal domain-containing protein [Rhizobiaceae bacterium]